MRGGVVKLFDPACTDSLEVKNFLLWLHAHGYAETWHAYDSHIRNNYRRSTGSSIDHMEEISRVMADPWFGVTE
jgi:hypothetical protein